MLLQRGIVVVQAAVLLSACRTPPRSVAPAVRLEPADAGVDPPPVDGGQPQPFAVLGDIAGTQVVALAAPEFAQLPHDQRMVAFEAAQALGAGEATAIDQGYRHNLEIVRVLRGILSRPQVVPPASLAQVRAFARVVWLNGGLHDYETGRKALPPFTSADFRVAALAAQAAGADLGFKGSAEFGLRALDAALFDPAVDAIRTVHGADLTASAVNLYDGVTQRDLRGLHEKYALNSRLARNDAVLVEQVIRVPVAAASLEHGLAFAAPPQRAVLEPLAAYFRSGEPAAFFDALRAFPEARGPVDFFAGFWDRSADPRSKKGLFGGFVGMADAERASPRSLLLLASAGSMRPLRSFEASLGGKQVLFEAAGEAAARVRTDAALQLFSGVRLTPCLPRLRAAFLSLRANAGHLDSLPVAADEARADAAAWAAGESLDSSCRRLWPQFAAAQWLLSAAGVPEGDRVEDDRQRARQLQIWWFTGKGALVEQQAAGRRILSVPDAARFYVAARELVSLLNDLARDPSRAEDLLSKHASRVDVRWRDEVLQRLKAAGLPRRVAVLPPRLERSADDVVALPVDDLDAQVLRDWQRL